MLFRSNPNQKNGNSKLYDKNGKLIKYINSGNQKKKMLVSSPTLQCSQKLIKISPVLVNKKNSTCLFSKLYGKRISASKKNINRKAQSFIETKHKIQNYTKRIETSRMREKYL